MLVYDTQFINNYYKTFEDEKLEQSIQDLLNTILETINNDPSSNNFDQENDFKLKKKLKYKKYDNYNSAKDFNNVHKFNKLNSLQTTSIRKVPVDKTKINIAKSNIKALLNKLSPSNYNKLETEFLVIYNELLESSIEESIDELYSMDNYIIDYICYNNLSYSSIYVNIFFSLLAIYNSKNYKLENIYFYNLLKEKYDDFSNFEKYIKCTNSKDNDEFTINKNNDKYKCFIVFIINIYKKVIVNELDTTKTTKTTKTTEITNYMPNLFINTCIIEEFVLLLTNFFITNLRIENNTDYCETILEFLMTIYSELFKEIRIIKKLDSNLKQYATINLLLVNKSSYVCFTNKIKFKLMDIQDKYKKYILL